MATLPPVNLGVILFFRFSPSFLHFGIRTYQNPAQLLTEINYYVTRDSSETNRFMSMFFLEVDQSEKTLRMILRW